MRKLLREQLKPLKNLRPEGDTHMGAGLKFSGDMLSTSESSRKTIILLSDGVDSVHGPDEIQKADELKKKGIEIYTIAIGSDADKETLKKIASPETDKLKYALTVTDSTIEMDSAFTHIVQEMGVFYRSCKRSYRNSIRANH